MSPDIQLTLPDHHQRRPYLNRGPQLTPRLEHLFPIIGQQGALRFDQVQRWLALYSPEPERLKQTGALSTERTRKILAPWFQEEVFSYRVFYARQKGWLWLTPKGIRYANLHLRYYEPSPASLPHLYAVNEVRLFLARRRPADRWRSERELRAEQHNVAEGSKRHLPDAELCTEKGIIALEVELTVKAEKRLHEILYDLASNSRYSTIWYFAPEQVRPALVKEVATLSPKYRSVFRLYDLQGKEFPL